MSLLIVTMNFIGWLNRAKVAPLTCLLAIILFIYVYFVISKFLVSVAIYQAR